MLPLAASFLTSWVSHISNASQISISNKSGTAIACKLQFQMMTQSFDFPLVCSDMKSRYGLMAVVLRLLVPLLVVLCRW